MNSILSLNENGIARMSVSDYEGASTAFGAAVKQAKADWQSLLTLPVSSSAETFRSVKVDDLIEHHGTFVIFGECFALSPLHEVNVAPQDPNFLVAVILYNGALAHHLQSLKDNSTAGRRKAVYLYNLALQLLHKSLASVEYYFLVLLAIANNLAAIAAETYNHASFEMHRRIIATIMLETEVPELFASNYVASMGILDQPAAAA